MPRWTVPRGVHCAQKLRAIPRAIPKALCPAAFRRWGDFNAGQSLIGPHCWKSEGSQNTFTKRRCCNLTNASSGLCRFMDGNDFCRNFVETRGGVVCGAEGNTPPAAAAPVQPDREAWNGAFRPRIVGAVKSFYVFFWNYDDARCISDVRWSPRRIARPAAEACDDRGRAATCCPLCCAS
jgi:hypothetical protein